MMSRLDRLILAKQAELQRAGIPFEPWIGSSWDHSLEKAALTLPTSTD